MLSVLERLITVSRREIKAPKHFCCGQSCEVSCEVAKFTKSYTLLYWKSRLASLWTFSRACTFSSSGKLCSYVGLPVIIARVGCRSSNGLSKCSFPRLKSNQELSCGIVYNKEFNCPHQEHCTVLGHFFGCIKSSSFIPSKTCWNARRGAPTTSRRVFQAGFSRQKLKGITAKR